MHFICAAQLYFIIMNNTCKASMSVVSAKARQQEKFYINPSPAKYRARFSFHSLWSLGISPPLEKCGLII
uniref:Uncharacterized protein n=1 Tax=Pararge aegeria TaxID=116150 RepID=S4P983_9NEOP